MKRMFFSLIATLLMVLSVMAQSTWVNDKAHSSVEFSVTHMVISEVTGKFKDFQVTIMAKDDSFSDGSVELTIKAASINTDNESRDNHLRSPDFLNAEQYPEMKFKSTKWEKAGENKYKVTGDLTIRDSTKPVVMDVTYRGSISDGRGGMKAGFKATTVIDRFEFGTVWDKKLENGGWVAGREINVTINLEMKKQMPEKKG